ncbi:MAG: EamA family transporter RarD [Microbacterium sp.]
MTPQHDTVRGATASIAASVLFGVIFYLAGFAHSSSAESVFGWRVVITFACYLLALAHPAVRLEIATFLRHLRIRWWMQLLSLCATAIVGVQLWLFMWAPMNGHALDASLGYLLLPICLVLGGRLILRTHVTRLQWFAVGLAVLAIATKLIAGAEITWVTFVICVPYATYFVMRRRVGLDGPVAFGMENAALVPIALLALSSTPAKATGEDLILVVAIGIASAVAMTLYLAAASLLSIPVFGLLGYIEPLLLVVVALALGERLHGADLVAYAILSIGLALLCAEGFISARRITDS